MHEAISTVEHDLHRVRRAALNPFFSKRSVNHLAPFIQNTVDKLCGRFDQAVTTAEPINLKNAFPALTSDIMYEFCFSRCPDDTLMPDFNKPLHDAVDGFMQMSLWVRDTTRSGAVL